MNRNTVTLVATIERVRQDFPSIKYTPRKNSRSGIVLVAYPINPGNCKTALGRWLAERILTTHFNDDASECIVLLPATEIGLHFKDCGEHLARHREIRTAADAERLFTSLQDWIAKKKKIVALGGAHSFHYRTIEFQWPVYGSTVAGNAETPEAYFDVAARQIRQTGGVILRAGLLRERLPDSIASTMVQNACDGVELLRRHEASRSAQSSSVSALS